MNSRRNCQARVIGDEYHCYRCGLVWDISDLDPPDCKNTFEVQAKIIANNSTYGKPVKNPEVEKKAINEIRNILNNKQNKVT